MMKIMCAVFVVITELRYKKELREGRELEKQKLTIRQL